MTDWNVVITVHEPNFAEALDLLGEYGSVAKTEYFNVAVMKADNPHSLMEKLHERTASDPALLKILSRVVPAAHTFNFQTPADFEEKAKEILLHWAPRLAGKGFHVRMHRRGFKGRLSSMGEEKFLNNLLLGALEQMGTPGRIQFDDPDMIVSVETIGQRTGISLWSREEVRRYPLLGLD